MPSPPTTLFYPRGRRYDFEESLRARIHDPLWLLCRQWQMGEFQGEDAGTPVQAEVEHDAFAIGELVFPERSFGYSPADAPLEAVVEREGAGRPGPDLRTRTQWGSDLLRQITEAGLPVDAGEFRRRFGLAAAERERLADAAPAVRLLAERGIDAHAIARTFRGDITDALLSETFSQAPDERLHAYRAIIEKWRTDYAARIGDPERHDAWLDERMEYGFSMRVRTDIGRIELEAQEYPGGRLDWDAFRVRRIMQGAGATAESRRERLLPTQVSFAGMPAPRFWELEDGSVDFGHPQAVEQDLGRLLLAEFVMAWGNDWFLVPVDAPTGALVRINSLLVTDTFGVTTRILAQSVHAPHWRMHRLTGDAAVAAAEDFLLIPPVLALKHQAPPLECVTFLRDEMANFAWAIEQEVADALGRPQPAADQVEVAPQPEREGENGDDARDYRVMTDLPEHWFPLVPLRDPGDRARYLARAGLIDEIEEQAPRPQSALLALDRAFRVHDEEIPRAGAELTRSYQLARWQDGRRALWVGRYKRPGTGGARSALTFDALIETGEGTQDDA